MDLFLLLIVGVLVAVVLTSADAINVLASSKYYAAHRLLPILVAGLLVYSVHIFLSAGLLIFKKTFTAAKMVILACILNVVMNVLLIPRMGLFAAALATLVSYAFLVALLARASFKVLPFRIEYGSLGRYILAGVFTVVLLGRMDLGNSLLNLLVKGLLGLLVYAGSVWLIDPRLRTLFAKISETRREFAGGVPATSLGEAVPTMKE